MSPAQAASIAHELYGDHPAAGPLILEAVQGASEQRRRRSAQALRWFDPMEDIGELPMLGADAALVALRWALCGQRAEDRLRAAEEVPQLLGELTR